MVANPGEAESVQAGTIPKLEGARESDRPTGHFTDAEPWARGSVCPLPPSEAFPLPPRYNQFCQLRCNANHAHILRCRFFPATTKIGDPVAPTPMCGSQSLK